MISKKLLEAVCPNTERYTYRIAVAYGKSTVEAIDHKWQGMVGTVNTYEVAHKCKEWAIKQDYGYIIRSEIKHTFGYARVEWYEKNHSDKHGTYRELTFYSDWFKVENNNEPEAIFQACEWILKELENEKR